MASGLAHEKLTNIPKPTIAKIAGYCIGGGLGIALCCDLRFATDDSKFGIPAAKLGLGYGYGGLKPLVGSCRAHPRQRDSCSPPDSLTHRKPTIWGSSTGYCRRTKSTAFVDEYTETIAGNAPLTIKACKQIVAEVCKDPADRDLALCKQLVDACFASEDYKEGQAGVHGKTEATISGQIGESEKTRKRENESFSPSGATMFIEGATR